MLNPSIVTVTLPVPTATQFRLRYLVAGSPIADLIVPALYNGAGSYVQPLGTLNSLVPPQYQGAEMVLVVSAISAGGESVAEPAAETVVVILPPQAPLTVVVS
jgi:hypothetical protein